MDDLLQRFAAQAPIAVMTHAALQRVLADSTLEDIFCRHAEAQYTRQLTFSAIVRLMTKVTFGTHKSVNAAYLQSTESLTSIVAVYAKLQNVELCVAQALVEETAQACQQIIAALPLSRTRPLAGLRLRTLDGNFLAGTEHRLEALRGSGAAALPGMSLVVRDGATGLLTNVIPCEDAYTNERALVERVTALVEPRDLWLADRNFCTLGYCEGIAQRDAFFLIRHHAGTKLEGIGKERYVGSNASGDLYEQRVRLSNSGFTCRCIIVKLHQPLRDGSKEMRLLTNVPRVAAKKLADLYRTRWQIESAFQELTCSLRCEINTLGYPKAALFAFCLAMTAYNVLTVIKAALASGQGAQKIEHELSSYHMATELATVQTGLSIAIAPEQWQQFVTMTSQEFAAWLHELAQGLDWSRYRKAKRGPQKPVKIQRTRRGAHRSTARVLKQTP